MAKRLVSTIALAIFGVSAALTACGDDSASQDDGGSGGASAGEAGSNNGAGTKTGGSASGGTTVKPGTGGNDGGGEAGMGGATTRGGEPAAGGSDPGVGGAPGAGGAAGAGGAGDTLTYACNSTTISHHLCSALVAASCPEATDCADCVAEKNLDREAFGSCPACGDQYDAFLRCGIDAFESGKISDGIECFAGFGADLNDTCALHLNETLACASHAEEFGCPVSWPVQ